MTDNEYLSRADGLMKSFEQIGFTFADDFADDDAREMVRSILLHAMNEAKQDGVRVGMAKAAQGRILYGSVSYD